MYEIKMNTVIIILLIILFYRPENDLSRKSIESLAGNCIIWIKPGDSVEQIGAIILHCVQVKTV